MVDISNPKIGSGEWGVGSGEWGVGSGEWGVGSGEWGVGKPVHNLYRSAVYR